MVLHWEESHREQRAEGAVEATLNLEAAQEVPRCRMVVVAGAVRWEKPCPEQTEPEPGGGGVFSM